MNVMNIVMTLQQRKVTISVPRSLHSQYEKHHHENKKQFRYHAKTTNQTADNKLAHRASENRQNFDQYHVEGDKYSPRPKSREYYTIVPMLVIVVRNGNIQRRSNLKTQKDL